MHSPSSQKPSVGRIVHFVVKSDEMKHVQNNGAEIAPAIVTRTWEETSYENDEVNLKVIFDGFENLW